MRCSLAGGSDQHRLAALKVVRVVTTVMMMVGRVGILLRDLGQATEPLQPELRNKIKRML